jgi:hypothetical protein
MPNTKRERTTRTWSISDGRETIGRIELRAEGQYVALLPNHSIVGRYPTWPRAMEAFNRRGRSREAGDATRP